MAKQGNPEKQNSKWFPRTVFCVISWFTGLKRISKKFISFSTPIFTLTCKVQGIFFLKWGFKELYPKLQELLDNIFEENKKVLKDIKLFILFMKLPEICKLKKMIGRQ